MSMKQILVIATPVQLQEGLQALLGTLSQVAVVVVADAGAAQAQMAQRTPHLVIIAGRRAVETLAALVNHSPAAHFLLLVEHARDKAAAEAAGADAALVEGAPASHLLDVVRDLLAEVSAGQMEVKQ